MHKQNEKILNHMKLISYQRPCNTESIAFSILVKFNVGNKNCISQFQALPSHPPGNPGVNLQNWQILATCSNFFIKCPSPEFPGSLYCNKFYTFPPLSRSQSLEYLQIRMDNMYLLIENINHMVVWW